MANSFTGQVVAGPSTMATKRPSDEIGHHFAEERFIVGENVPSMIAARRTPIA